MLDAEEKEVSSRGRLDLLLEQLGIDVFRHFRAPSAFWISGWRGPSPQR